MIRTNPSLLAKMHELQLQGRAQRRIFPSGSYIIEQDRWLHHVFVLEEGLAKCAISLPNGEEFLQEFFGEGSLFGEIEAIHSRKSFCSVQAISEVRVLEMSQSDFTNCMASQPPFAELIIKSLAEKVYNKAVRHGYQRSSTVVENVQALYVQFPALVERINKGDIARYLGITVRSLNRALKELGLPPQPKE